MKMRNFERVCQVTSCMSLSWTTYILIICEIPLLSLMVALWLIWQTDCHGSKIALCRQFNNRIYQFGFRLVKSRECEGMMTTSHETWLLGFAKPPPTNIKTLIERKSHAYYYISTVVQQETVNLVMVSRRVHGCWVTEEKNVFDL